MTKNKILSDLLLDRLRLKFPFSYFLILCCWISHLFSVFFISKMGESWLYFPCVMIKLELIWVLLFSLSTLVCTQVIYRQLLFSFVEVNAEPIVTYFEYVFVPITITWNTPNIQHSLNTVLKHSRGYFIPHM